MNAFNDATCPKCRKKFGWMGSLKDRPPCPECGHKIDPKILEHDEAELARARAEILAEMQREEEGK